MSDRLVVITGIGRAGQVGEALALALARDGATVAVIDREAQMVDERVRDLERAGYRARGAVCDLTDPEHTGHVARELVADAPLHALVNAAGGFAMSGPVGESDVGVWHRQIAISLTTAYVATRAFMAALRRGKGSIVYFGSAAALPGARVAEMSAYAVAKTGVLTLMRAVSAEEWKNGVRANAVAPTSIRTAANVASMGADQSYVERESVAETIRWLCSDAARDVTGQTIRLGS